MSDSIDRVSDAMRQLQPDHEFWIDAVLDITNGPYIEARYRNPELAGIWVFLYAITRGCAEYMVDNGYVYFCADDVFRSTYKFDSQ